MNKWGDGCPKPLLKKILYSGLNGASLTSRPTGAISSCVKEAHGKIQSTPFIHFEKSVLGHPILQELALFHDMVGSRDLVYLPSQTNPYYGRQEEESLLKKSRSL